MKILLCDIETKRRVRLGKVDINNLEETDECIDHQQKGNSDGYGHRGPIKLHRLVFKVYNGYLPEVVMHSCDNPRCINPKHLKAGSWDLNNKDRATKGRSAKVRFDLRKISFEQAEIIRKRYNPKRDPINGVSAIARDYAVDRNTIYQIVRMETHLE